VVEIRPLHVDSNSPVVLVGFLTVKWRVS
jgi:hypothetical protein